MCGEIRQHGLAGDGARADGDHRLRICRHIDIDARAETDEAEALANRKLLALAHEADDAARHEPGDLHDAETSLRRVDHEAVALIVLARLVEIGVDEETRTIGDARDAAGDRRAVHMHVEDAHEDGDALQRLGAETELGRRQVESHGTDDAVGGRDHEALA